MVASESPAAMVSDVDVQIRQGFLENSNVSSMQEMVQLMQTMRHFESMQKVATGYDEMMGTAIRKLGDLA
jgi:flagellar basal-body rod protein FlgF